MKEKSSEIIEIPEGFEVEISDSAIVLRKNGNEIIKKLKTGNKKIKIKKQDNKILIESDKSTKRERKLTKTIKAHISNILLGLKEKFVYKVQICFVHFPSTISVDKDKNEFLIKNFLGENKVRKAKILPNVDVKIEKDIITIESTEIEAAGQTAANLEKATKIKLRDRRIFQDGCYIISKPER